MGHPKKYRYNIDLDEEVISEVWADYMEAENKRLMGIRFPGDMPRAINYESHNDYREALAEWGMKRVLELEAELKKRDEALKEIIELQNDPSDNLIVVNRMSDVARRALKQEPGRAETPAPDKKADDDKDE